MPAIVNFLTPSPGPNIIEVIDTGGDNEIDVLEIHSEWKDWLLADAGPRLGLPQAFTVIGGEPKSPTQDLGQAFFLHPEWKIRPAERDHRLVVNGDIQVLGGVGRVTVDTLGAFTVEVSFNTSTLITGLTNPVLSASETASAVWSASDSGFVAADTKGRALALVEYSRCITISSTGTGGSVLGVNGTPSNPVDNVADAVLLSAEAGFVAWDIRTGSFTLTAALTEWTVTMHDEVELDLGGQNVNGTDFQGGKIKGTMTGTIKTLRLAIEDVVGLAGRFTESCLTGNIAPAAGAAVDFNRCHAIAPFLGAPVLDFTAGNITATMTTWSLGLQVENMVDAGSSLVVGYTAGGFTIDASCTTGSIFYHGGAYPVTDNSAGTTVNDFTLATANWQRSLTDMVTAGTAGESMALIRKVHTNRLDAAPGNPATLILYDDDGTTPLKTWNLLDYLGAAVTGVSGAPALRGAAT